MPRRLTIRYLLLLIVIISLVNICKSQCTLTAPKTICIGNLGYFNIGTVLSTKISKVVWDFGDGYTAKFQNTGHLYKNTGDFKVKCKITFNDNSTCEDSVALKVVDLPKADFDIIQLNNCLASNQVCLKNSSKPVNSSQNIVSSLVLWDDGSYTKMDTLVCHKYKQAGDYRITIEITDNKGCKSLKGKDVQIIPSPKAQFSVSSSQFCGTSKICINNTSEIPSFIKTISFWQIEGGSPFEAGLDSQLCYNSLIQKDYSIKLILKGGNGCSDTLTEIHHLKVDTISNIQMALSDSSVCYKTKVTARIIPKGEFNYQWNYENNTTSDIEIDTRSKGKFGKNLLRCTVTKGNCKLVLEKNLEIKGPKARIKIFNKIQCGTGLKVYFIDSSIVSDTKKTNRLWVLEDPYGDSCISFRAKKINLNKNCNFSKDWYHKHTYSDTAVYKVTYFLYDSITQCSDTVNTYVETNACNSEKKEGECFTKNIFCQGDFIMVNPRAKIVSEMISLDTGKTWHKLPWKITSNYKGIYSPMVAYNIDSSYISDYGDDSIKLFLDSTISYSYLLLKVPIEIRETPDSKFTYMLSKGCNTKDMFIYLNDSLVKAGDKLDVYWGDKTSSSYYTMKDSIFNKIEHRYLTRYMNDSIKLFRYASNGCFSYNKLPIKFGYFLTVDSLKPVCFGQEVCVKFNVTDYGTNELWSELNGLGKVKIMTSEGKVFDDDFSPCFTDTFGGKKGITLIATSQDGCSDTIDRQYYISHVKAGITQASKYFGCGEIKQLFDSSIIFPKDSSMDSITDYAWEFEKVNNVSVEKDPFHAFSKYGKFKVYHKVMTQNACWDTVTFTVNVVGPQANFEILDTIGCEPFTAVFKNKTRHSSMYYWDFGDHEYNTYLSSDTSDVEFTYSQAGKYYIRLTAIDTFFSATTQTLYYCNDTFPRIAASRSVTVVPFLHAAFDCKDTLCVNEPLNIQNLSDKRIKILHWDFGDGLKKSSGNDPLITHTYKNTGTYKITLIPDYPIVIGQPSCFDTATKLIQIKGSLANFEFEKLCNNSPLTQFINTTKPDFSSSKYKWHFGQPQSSNNETTEKSPKHDFGLNINNYEVCLSVIDTFGCFDSICILINNNYTTKLKIPNVFTPGFMDDKNDEFDILIEGEEYYDLFIYNRWGLLMYHDSKDGEKGDGINWNGKVDNVGNECPGGTYFYIFEYKNCYGDLERKRTSGVITLVR